MPVDIGLIYGISYLYTICVHSDFIGFFFSLMIHDNAF